VDKDIEKWNEQLTVYGHGNSNTVYDLAEEVKPGAVSNFLGQFGNYSLSRLNLDSLEMIIQLANERGIEILLVEMPYHPSLIDFQDESGNPHPQIVHIQKFIQQVHEQLEIIAAQNQVPYWKTSDLDIFPEDGWHDRYHLNEMGSQVFSRWLGGKIAEAVENGEIERLGK
jgi:hypothetical protein